MAKPKIWRCFDGRLISVETPETLYAKHLLELYNRINSTYLYNEERVDLLEAIKATVKVKEHCLNVTSCF